MDYSLYSYSLSVALPLMIFFGFYLLFGRTPDKAIFGNFLRSRRIMGTALLLLAANYSVHFFFEIRFKSVNSAILMNLSTYFVLLSVQLCNDNAARPFLYNAQKVEDTHHSMGYLLNPFRSRIIAVAVWIRSECCVAGFSCMAGDLRTCAGSQSHCRIPQSRQNFR